MSVAISRSESHSSDRYRVEALARGLGILALFTDATGSLSLSEIARRTGLSTATTLRLVRTLEAAGFLEQSSASRQYAVGAALRRGAEVGGQVEKPDVLNILDLFTEDHPEWSLSDLAGRLGLEEAAVRRSLQPVVERGYLERDPQTGHFRVGIKPVTLSYLALTRLPVRTHALPVLAELLEATDLDTTLAVQCGTTAVYVVRLNAPEVWKGHTGVGRAIPLHCSAVGKVMLAHLSPEEVERLLDQAGLPRFTDTTITERSELIEQLATVRATGYAVDGGEWMPERGCVAAPVRDARGEVIAAVGASGETAHILAQEQHLSRQVRDAANRISYTLGYLRAYY